MATSLLAHLYSHIKGSQEDVATLSLQYIVSRSAVLNQEFTRLLCNALHGVVHTVLNYVCQSVGENRERPDLAGIDATGKEHILCEAKFYAGLTENQPNGYLDRLQQERDCGLVFICPAARRVTLWSKLLELCRERIVTTVAEYCVEVDGVRMAILTWADIIESLRHAAASAAPDMLPDIYQLDGFCKLEDSEAFLPFSAEDFGPENAIREQRHYQVLDAVANALLTDKSILASTKRLRATPYWDGYVRYIRVMKYTLSIRYDRRMWRSAESVETPYWVVIKDDNWKQPAAYRKALNGYQESWKEKQDDDIALALFAPINASLDEIAVEIKKQIIDYIQTIEESLK